MNVFRTHLAFGYLVWIVCGLVYVLPWLRRLDREGALRAIAMLHSFRFFGLVFLVPGFVGPNLPAAFAAPAAYGDFATSILALATVLAFRVRSLFRPLVVAFNIVGAADLILDTVHAVQLDLPSIAGQLGAAYAIPIIYVPLLMVTHGFSFYLMFASRSVAAERIVRVRDVAAV